ncbi:MAG TPA: hypothetical protein VGH19_14575 [Verrucomicrobiae bacterium]
MKHITILTVLMLAVLCSSHAVHADEPAESSKAIAARRQQETNDILETLFRYQIATNQVTEAKVYFLSVSLNAKGQDIFDSARDPSIDFMKRFADLKTPVQKASASTFSQAGWVVEKRNDQRGVIFNSEKIKWISPTEVEVTGSFYAGMLYARGYTFTVKKEKDKWSVTAATETWMS